MLEHGNTQGGTATGIPPYATLTLPLCCIDSPPPLLRVVTRYTSIPIGAEIFTRKSEISMTQVS